MMIFLVELFFPFQIKPFVVNAIGFHVPQNQTLTLNMCK